MIGVEQNGGYSLRTNITTAPGSGLASCGRTRAFSEKSLPPSQIYSLLFGRPLIAYTLGVGFCPLLLQLLDFSDGKTAELWLVWVNDRHMCCNPISAAILTWIFQHANIKTIRLPLNLMIWTSHDS